MVDSAITRRLRDSRSTPGILSRGSNIYNGGSNYSGSNTRTMQPARTTQPAPTTSVTPQTGTSSTSISRTGTVNPDPMSDRDANTRPYPTPRFDPNDWIGLDTLKEGISGDLPAPTTPMDDFDAIYEKRLNDIMAQQAQLNSRREQALRALDQQKAFSQDALKRMFERNLERNEINMADRGLYRSGINVREQGDIGENYQNDLGQAVAQFASQREGIEGNYAQVATQFQDLISQLQQERAVRAEEEERKRAETEAQNRALQPVLSPTGRYTSPVPTQTSDRSFGGGGTTTTQPQQSSDWDRMQAVLRRLGQ